MKSSAPDRATSPSRPANSLSRCAVSRRTSIGNLASRARVQRGEIIDIQLQENPSALYRRPRLISRRRLEAAPVQEAGQGVLPAQPIQIVPPARLRLAKADTVQTDLHEPAHGHKGLEPQIVEIPLTVRVYHHQALIVTIRQVGTTWREPNEPPRSSARRCHSATPGSAVEYR